jgi:hypothetical protein
MRDSLAMIRRCATAAAAALVVVAVCASPPATSATKPLPEGCNLQYGGQLISAFVNRATTFHFEMYNAVPPGHKIRSPRVSWGDGKSSAVSAKTRTKPMFKGCYVTIFTGRHTYHHVDCVGSVCSKNYKVRLRYRDARTNASHTNAKLHVLVVRRNKK